MPENVQIHMLNQTPLTLTIEHVLPGQAPEAIGEVGPLAELVKDIAGGVIVAKDKSSGHELKRLSVDEAAAALVVTPDDLRSGPRGKAGTHKLTIKNSTDRYLDMDWILPSGQPFRFGPRL